MYALSFSFTITTVASPRINQAYFTALEELQDFKEFEVQFFNENYANARNILNQIIYNYPDEMYLYFIRGYLSVELEDYGSARNDMNNYLYLNPNDINGYKLNMIACLRQEDYQTALQNCRAGLALDSNDQELNSVYQKLSSIEEERIKQEKLVRNAQDVSTQVSGVLEIVNEERQKAGLNPLSLHSELNEAAMKRAEEIVDVFSHTRPDGSSCFSVLDQYAKNRAVGENIAAGQSDAQEVMMGWMESPGHRANIMKPEYKYIGIGYVYKNGTCHWVQLFMS